MQNALNVPAVLIVAAYEPRVSLRRPPLAMVPYFECPLAAAVLVETEQAIVERAVAVVDAKQLALVVALATQFYLWSLAVLHLRVLVGWRLDADPQASRRSRKAEDAHGAGTRRASEPIVVRLWPQVVLCCDENGADTKPRLLTSSLESYTGSKCEALRSQAEVSSRS